MPHLPISVLLLGMGADMHTASLFPGRGQPGRRARRSSAAVDGDARRGGRRAARDLTAPVLKGAMSTHILITGAEKREAIERAAKMHPMDAPIATVLGQANIHWAE
jgi:6-phosphogluconolactonase